MPTLWSKPWSILKTTRRLIDAIRVKEDDQIWMVFSVISFESLTLVNNMNNDWMRFELPF